jgi:hypothetical protein
MNAPNATPIVYLVMDNLQAIAFPVKMENIYTKKLAS